MECLFAARIAVFGGAVAGLIACGPRPGDDYLDVDLRRRVDALVAEVDAAPTTQDIAMARAEVFWEWVNAYAAAGRTLPMDSTTTVMRITRQNALGNGIAARMLRTFDDKLHELALRDRDADAIGEVIAVPGEMLVAGSRVELEQVYRVGTLGMSTGGGFLLGAQIMANQEPMQHEYPAAPNYVSLQTSNPSARFEKERMPLSGKHGGFKDDAQMVVFRLAGGSLDPGDEARFVYGDRSQGSLGLRLQTLTTQALVFPI